MSLPAGSSGAGHNVSSREHAAEIAELFLHELGFSARDDDALARAPLSAILSAQSSVAIQRSMRQGILAWQPSVDGDVLPAKALEGIAQGVSKSVPVLVGTNADEWNLFLLGDREGRRLDSEGLRRRLERALPGADASGRPRADAALEAYLRARSGRGRESSVRFWVAFQSDRIFHYPATRVADLQLAHQPSVYAYLFTFAPPVVGACHGLELPFVFGTLRAPLLGPLLGWSPSAQALSRAMQDAWIALARTGNPAHEGLPDWPSYDAARRCASAAAAAWWTLPSRTSGASGSHCACESRAALRRSCGPSRLVRPVKAGRRVGSAVAAFSRCRAAGPARCGRKSTIASRSRSRTCR